MASPSSPPPRGDVPQGPRWRAQLISLKLEDAIFTIDRRVLLQASPVFKDMFFVGDSSTGEGMSEGNPIRLEGYKAHDFEALLQVLYPTTEDLISGKFSLTKEEWIGVLKLARAWEMQKIREFAVCTLSDESMKLSKVEKVNLGREHGVASWLLEGVTSLVERDPDISADDLEASIGIRTAFKIVSLQARSENSGPISTVLVNGTLYPSFPLSALCCQNQKCPGRIIGAGGLACHSCSKSVGLNDRRAIYLSTYSTIWPNFRGGPCFAFTLDELQCSSCKKRLLVRPIPCQSCGMDYLSGYGIAVLCGSGWPAVYMPSSAIQEVFKDDLAGCDM